MHCRMCFLVSFCLLSSYLAALNQKPISLLQTALPFPSSFFSPTPAPTHLCRPMVCVCVVTVVGSPASSDYSVLGIRGNVLQCIQAGIMLISPDDASQEHHTLTGMLPRCKWYAEHKVESKTAKCNIRGFAIHAKVFFLKEKKNTCKVYGD